MRTLIVSDLHLGSGTRSDLLRRAELRAPLLEALADVDRLVLLGDVLELRHGPPREALAAARPFFEDLGRALADRELVMTAGNHDHALVEPWLAGRGAQAAPQALGVERLLAVRHASPMLEQIADWASPARTVAAYPGLWIRPDVYAMHGHYLDCHLTVPTLERLSVAAMSRVLGRPASTFSRAEDYEAVAGPVFAWRDAVARDVRTGSALNGLATVSAWRALRGGGSKEDGSVPDTAAAPRLAERDSGLDVRGESSGVFAAARRSAVRNLRRRALVGAFPLAVAALNRAGLGPLRAAISTSELRRAGLLAIGEVAARLDLGEAYVVFGHTHRAGPLPGDHESEWRGRGGARLVNSGCWTYDPIFLTPTPGESPYWPGTAILVEDSGPPVVKRLLLDRAHEELAQGRSSSGVRSDPTMPVE
ncbi:MAG TPA: metallophosphoesterase [Solirubrobacteraceae bacterium]|jgi:3',5'-cyclic AMP phosphodiesterase CpdA